MPRPAPDTGAPTSLPGFPPVLSCIAQHIKKARTWGTACPRSHAHNRGLTPRRVAGPSWRYSPLDISGLSAACRTVLERHLRPIYLHPDGQVDSSRARHVQGLSVFENLHFRPQVRDNAQVTSVSATIPIASTSPLRQPRAKTTSCPSVDFALVIATPVTLAAVASALNLGRLPRRASTVT
ncbi:hypothetical protein A1Q2_07879 [Trichosporon asahii var. asahii CBS 8904]|uniref:Uncharacterized protein n=1 Tax=Trichosporon asahii var. asahii (strain CBS 8904) TaxID=1220162 RepID=K1VFL6_TRIAC|nr:hypothetical protein A1Q2_07879 [Trichosporon asahii var. asahii CBS 8904]